jgi:hypothetical protein
VSEEMHVIYAIFINQISLVWKTTAHSKDITYIALIKSLHTRFFFDLLKFQLQSEAVKLKQEKLHRDLRE